MFCLNLTPRYYRKYGILESSTSETGKGLSIFPFWYIFSPLYFLFFIGFVSRIFFVSLQTDIKWDWTWKIICFPLLFPLSFHQPKLLFVAREKDRSEINLCKMSALMNCLGFWPKIRQNRSKIWLYNQQHLIDSFVCVWLCVIRWGLCLFCQYIVRNSCENICYTGPNLWHTLWCVVRLLRSERISRIKTSYTWGLSQHWGCEMIN